MRLLWGIPQSAFEQRIQLNLSNQRCEIIYTCCLSYEVGDYFAKNSKWIHVSANEKCSRKDEGLGILGKLRLVSLQSQNSLLLEESTLGSFNSYVNVGKSLNLFSPGFLYLKMEIIFSLGGGEWEHIFSVQTISYHGISSLVYAEKCKWISERIGQDLWVDSWQLQVTVILAVGNSF